MTQNSFSGDDDLTAPLGLGGPPARRAASPGLRRALAAGCALAVLGGALSLWAAGDPMGGEPYATAAIEAAPKREAAAAAPAAQTDPDKTASISAAQKSPDDSAETQNGVKITRVGQQQPGALIISVPEALGVRLTPAPDRRLAERLAEGIAPKIGADGSRPSDIYARPLMTGARLKPNAPRIALLIGGLGLNPQTSGEVIAKMPGAVTLAFAPYGPDLERQVGRARADGHEVMLQAPMEPFGYPGVNPGAHTLRADAQSSETTADLHWLMTRFAGYTGIVNFLGGRFTGEAGAFAPVLREIGSRGLFYLDDGSSPRSLAVKLARDSGVQAAQADVMIDAAAGGALEAQLLKLEGLARGRGVAIGVAEASPATAERIARFARALEGRGIALVPVSAAMAPAAALAAGTAGQ